jgi:hypothetical protein
MNQNISVFKYLELIYGLGMDYNFEVEKITKFELYILSVTSPLCFKNKYNV